MALRLESPADTLCTVDVALPNGDSVTADGIANTSWTAWFSMVSQVLSAMQQSGTTAQRPTVFLWVGRRYFDLTLAAGAGRPIWYNGTIWVDSAGVAV